MRVIWAIFRKDLLIELRTKSAINSMLFFGVVTLLIFNFALGSEDFARPALPGVLWTAFALAGTLGLNRMFASEKENRCIEGLLMIPSDRGAVYLGKMLAGSVFMLIAETVVFILGLFFFNVTVWREVPLLALTFLTGTLGFMSVGTLLSAIAVNTRLREILLPMLLFPVILPVLINAVEATGIILNGGDFGGLKLPICVMSVFALVFGTIAWLLFEYVLED